MHLVPALILFCFTMNNGVRRLNGNNNKCHHCKCIFMFQQDHMPLFTKALSHKNNWLNVRVEHFDRHLDKDILFFAYLDGLNHTCFSSVRKVPIGYFRAYYFVASDCFCIVYMWINSQVLLDERLLWVLLYLFCFCWFLIKPTLSSAF